MAWIKTIDPDDAQGLLGTIYEEATRRAGKVFNILRVQSLNPKSLRASIGMYMETMRGELNIPRSLREMLATVVSAVNACHY